MHLFARLRDAFSRASASQWVAYIIVMIAIIMLMYVIIDRIQSPRMTESYTDTYITESDSANCSEMPVGNSGCTNTSTENCNKMTFDKKAEFNRNLTILQPTNANTNLTGMDNLKFCSDTTCSETRSLQDVVNEYKYHHIPSQLHKVNKNRIPIVKEFNVLMDNRCKIKKYISDLKTSNEELEEQIDYNEAIISALRSKQQNLQKSLP